MRKIIVAGLFMILPIIGIAAPTAADESASGYSMTDILLVSAGMIAGAVLADFLISSALTVPAASTVSPTAIAEASAAGAVFGDQIAAATAIKDTKARADMLYALLIGSGAILGAITLDQIWSWTTPVGSPSYSK